jgi:hypothetical protein
METTYEIPAQTRTLYFQINNIEKYKLNLPRLLIQFEKASKIIEDSGVHRYYLRECGEYLWTIKAINENNQLCWTPLPNILKHNVICFGYCKTYPKTINEFKEKYYNSLFSCSGNMHLKYYLPYKINLASWEMSECQIHNFYKNWQNIGKLELKLMN